MNNGEWVSLAVIAACFIAGYSIISFLINKIKSNRSATSGDTKSNPAGQKKTDSENETEGGTKNQRRDEQNKHERGEQEKTGQSGETDESYGEEQRYSNILGLREIFTTEDIIRTFRELIAKYHPDKVNHLGDEFKKIAEIRTLEIMEAYDYFRKKYNIR